MFPGGRGGFPQALDLGWSSQAAYADACGSPVIRPDVNAKGFTIADITVEETDTDGSDTASSLFRSRGAELGTRPSWVNPNPIVAFKGDPCQEV